MRRPHVTAWLAVTVVAALIAGCGGDDNSSSGTSSSGGTSSSKPQKGGTLTMLANGDVDNNLDPGYSYYQYDFILDNDLHRTLYRYKPNDTTKPSPDLADGDAQISSDGKEITVTIKKGVKFSPPVNREVKTADVKYAMERDFLPQVGNGYANSYWPDIVGVPAFKAGKAKEISGITTPDDYTLKIKLTRPVADIVVGAMSLPGTAPVPKEYAAKFDEGKKSEYGPHLVTTGPYMVENDASGKVTGYQPGRRITLVRNPNWDPKTDFRPAYLEKIIVQEGEDPSVGNRKVLAGQSLIANPVDMAATPDFLKSNLNGPKKDQLVPSSYTGRTRWVALNTTKKPFDNADVRRAVAAGLNRQAMLLGFGGTAVGQVASHILPPGIAGFEEAGGQKGTGVDFLAKPEGDPALAAEYLKKAGFANGKYSGPPITIVADNAGNQKAAAQVVLDSMQKLGFNVKFRTTVRDTMFSKFCAVPKNEPEVCPSVGWLKDFADPQTMIDPVFNGKNIVQTGTVNWSLLDDKTLNAEMDKAETVVGAQERAQAWADIDKKIIATAAAIPWMWDKPYLVRSKNVNPVLNKANAAWDLSFMSIQQ
jgi:peptide/nickel transport system substrate-binding protein